MNRPTRKQILLTNDDGIQSPGLWAAAEALSSLGFVTIAAPREQYTGAGRSQPLTSDGRIETSVLRIGSQQWDAYAVGGSPSQCVMFGVLELMKDSPPDLVVSGINYGENVGSGVTASGTIGAALEAASFNIPALAVSLQLPDEDFLTLRTNVDFRTAGHFTRLFAERMLAAPELPEDVDLIKIDVPFRATPETPWQVTRLARHRYYIPSIGPRIDRFNEPGVINWKVEVQPGQAPIDSDVHVLVFDKKVTVTPLSLDLTSRVGLNELESWLNTNDPA